MLNLESMLNKILLQTIINQKTEYMLNKIFTVLAMSVALFSCNNSNKSVVYEKGSFGYDLNYLLGKDSVVVLSDNNDKSQVLISPKYQGKVFTSSLDGLNGKSIGWVNYKAIDSEVPDEHMNGFGGENRFWLGPEGGLFSIFFAPEAEQIMDNWHTPKAVDTEAWNLVSHNNSSVALYKEMNIRNYKGTEFSIGINRNIELIDRGDIKSLLDESMSDDLKYVAYRTINKITNKNDFAWTESTGTVCMWMLDMYPPSDSAYTIIPFNEGCEKELRTRITSDYFGDIPSDRLYEKNGVFIFKTDGKYRSKLGLNPKRSKGIAGNFNKENMILTIVTFGLKKDDTYLNQEWNVEKNPLIGDVFNAYNDGPLADGTQMGPFLELESSSPAAFLESGESMEHIHNVYHFSGSMESLNAISEHLLDFSLYKLK